MLSVVSSTHDTWKDLNFAELQKVLETTVVDLAANREKGDAGKTTLVQLVRDFRKTAPDEIRKAVAPILRSFQVEVDACRKRCTYAEDAYISMYKRLIDLPDPTLALSEVQNLQKRANKSVEVELEIRKLKEGNELLKAEVAELRPFESESKRLQKLVDDMNNHIESEIKTKTSRLQEESRKTVAEKEQEMAILRAEMNEKLGSMEANSLSLSKALEMAQSEVFKLKMQLDNSEGGRSSEVEILAEELEKSNAKIKSLEEKMASLENGGTTDSESVEQIAQLRANIEELTSDLAHKEAENSALSTTLTGLKEEKTHLQESMQNNINELQKSLSEMSEKLNAALTQLKDQSDYADVCRELALLRSIEFSEENSYTFGPVSDGTVTGDAAEIASEDSKRQQPLEMLLFTKNRALQNQLAQASVANDQLKADNEHLKAFETEARQQLQEQRELISLLESDLYRVQMAYNDIKKATPFPTASSTSSLSNLDPVHDQSNRMEGVMLAHAMGEKDENSPTQAESTDLSLLPIIQHQRDRFRTRAEELEQTETNLRQQLSLVQREVESVRADNVKLYEKIRFLQSYSSPLCARAGRNSTQQQQQQQRKQAGTEETGAITTSDGTSTAVHLATSDPTVIKYSQAYEAQLNPFHQFSRQERLRFVQGLPPHEKLMFRIGRVVLGDRRARLIAFLYALVLHLLIFIALYKVAYSQDTAIEAESSCLRRYADHMRSVHNQALNKP
ncbi:unnamed protein product [Calicophoron daubneyi]|uniref:Protein CASP n=1 Tax=Calicophoron daubneyi TaxID=300641 RepID=A0AAV2TTI6_CALDB